MEITFFIFHFLKNWWWFFFSLINFLIARFFYFWWIRWEIFYKKAFKWILLEIKPPKEVLKPFSAMETVYSLLFGLYDDPNWRERWCKGALRPGAGGWFSFEICSFGGDIHFYLRIPEGFRGSAESAIYSQYPDTEITLVEDYTQRIPKDIPNEKWDLYSEDYTLARPDHFPIKTYSMFFERPEEEKRVVEEKRLDPLNSLLESLSLLQSGEQVWFQLVCAPFSEDQLPWNWKTAGKEEVDKIAKGKTSPPKKMPIFRLLDEIFKIVEDVIKALFGGSSPPKKEQPLELIAPELRLTAQEKEIVAAIEKKMSKSAFLCWARVVYIYKKDEPHFPGNASLIRGFLTPQFSAEHLNRIVFFGATRTRIHYWIKDRRLYLRKRQRLREYIERLPSFFPWNIIGEPPPFIKFLTLFGYRIPPGKRSILILNTEELATIFHFPIKIYIPTVPRVETKRVGPPPTLPG
jgi:hypothetical protein